MFLLYTAADCAIVHSSHTRRRGTFVTTATTIAKDVLAELRARFPDLDWDAILAAPGRATLQEVVDAAIAVGVDPDVVDCLTCIDPPGFLH
jgi:DNA-binding transcriptional LysR family regulator